jgi:hypothetical protein
MTPEIQNALNVITAALGSDNPVPIQPPPVVVRWWVPTDEDATKFAKRIGWTVHDLYGNRQANGSTTDPYIVACDGSEADALLYASFGFDPTGRRMVYAADNREAAQALCDKLAATQTAAEANEYLRGAGDMNPNLARYLVMTGNVQGGGLMGSPHLGSFGGATTVAEAVARYFAQSSRKPGSPGASGF